MLRPRGTRRSSRLAPGLLAVLLAAPVLSPGAAPGQAPPKAASPEKTPTAQTQKMTAPRYDYTAETFEPAAKQGRVRAGNLVWTCKGTRCTISGPWQTPDASACRALAEEVGKIRKYERPGKALSAAELAKCNSGLSAAPVAGKRSAATARRAAAASSVRAPTDRPTEPSSAPSEARATARARPTSDFLPGMTVNEDGSVRIRTNTLTITGMGEEAVPVPSFSPVSIRTQELTITGLGEQAIAVPEFTPVHIRTRELTITGLGD